MKAILRHSSLARKLNSNIIEEAITAILIILWIYTGITKLIDYRSFGLQTSNSTISILRDNATLVSFGVPILELVMAFLLVFKKTRLIGFYLSLISMATFTVYVAYLMIYLPHLPCSCGGIISELNWAQHLVLNIVLTILSFIGIIIVTRKLKLKKR